MFGQLSSEDIGEGIVWCTTCKNWFPVEDGLLDLLTGPLGYLDDRKRFWDAHASVLEKSGFLPDMPPGTQKQDLQSIQQAHFDWYASNEVQTYNAYEQQPFWVAADRLAFDQWRKDIAADGWLLDVGCAEGRSTFKVMDLPINIVGFDVSKPLVRQALGRYRAGSFAAKADFCVADASAFPFGDFTFDYVLVYGVLHHLPDPDTACKEVARVLKLRGRYFGSENNRTIFRAIFELLQKVNPLWHEQAGPEALLSRDRLRRVLRDAGLRVETHSSVFIPPHLVNLLSEERAYQVLSIADRIAGWIPILRDHGGLLVINATKSQR